MKRYCDFCCNSTVEPSLNSDNDLSYSSVGKIVNEYNMFIRSGDGRPTALIVACRNKELEEYIDIGEYKMKFCPECGRELIENK